MSRSVNFRLISFMSVGHSPVLWLVMFWFEIVILLFVVSVYVWFCHPPSPSVRFMLHQYCCPDAVKFVLVCIMLVLLSIVLFVSHSTHAPLLLLHHEAFILSMLLLSVTVAFSVIVGHCPMLPVPGCAWCAYGA